MNKIVTPTLLLTLLCATAFTQHFTGKIVYTNTFTDLNNKDISAKMIPFLGKEMHYFINDSNYKACNENNRLLNLYNAATNTYYDAAPGSDDLLATDAGKPTGETYSTKMLAEKATICGYECVSMEEKKSSVTTVYYYSPKVQVNKNNFKQHNYSNWNDYLKASNGALPLKMIYTDKTQGFVWTLTAKSVEPMKLTATDFAVAAEKKKPQTTSAPVAGWLLYNGKDWGINFPGTPEESQQKIPTAIGEQTMHIYMYTEQQPTADNIVYAVIQSIFPDSLVNSAKTEMIEPLMRNSVDGAVKNVQGQLLSESVISLGEYPGREVKVSYRQGAGIINLRIYLVKNTLYMLQTICNKNKDNNASTKTFMNSFKLQ